MTFLTGLLCTYFSIACTFGAQPALTAFQGGTGTSSPSGILYGDQSIRLKTVTIGSNLTWDGTTLSASTTTNSGMSAGSLYVGSGGIFQTAASSSIFGYTPLNPTRQLTVAGTAQQITSSAGAQDLSSDRTWTLSLPSLVVFPSNATSTLFSTTYGSTTDAVIGRNLTFGGITADTWPEFCETITGSTALCDGSDASGVGGTGLATTTPISDSNVLVYSASGAGAAYGVATGTVSSANTALTVTSGRSVIGGSLTLTVSTTTTTMFTGTAGQVLAYGATGWTGVATTTFSGGLLYASGNVTNTLTAGDGLTRTVDDFDCDTASGSVFGCLSTTDWTTFNSKLGAYDPFTHPSSGQSATTSLMVFNSASSTFVGQLRSGHFYGDITGRSSTTLALSANGSNCSSGSSPLGVDTVGAVENCFDVWTEAENTAAAYLSTVDISANTNLTAGDGLTLTLDDLDCDTASGSVFGCLSTTDWSAFNLKLGSYDAWTHPAAGQSATTSQINVAGLLSTASSTFTGNATTTGNHGFGSVRIPLLTSALLVTDANGLLGEFAGTTCTNQVIEDLSALGAATCVSINNGYWSGTDLSVANGGTGLSTFGGTNTVLYTTAADTLSSEAAFTYDASQDLLTVASTSITKATTTSLFSTTASSTNLFSSALTVANQALSITSARVATMLGSWDFGGADSIEIVNGTAPVVNAIGETALDTTANQLLVATSTNATYPAVLPLEQPLFSITIGSTTPEFISSGTIPISRWVGKGREVTRVECFVTGGTSKVMNISDGTNDTETTTCATTNTQDNSLDTNPTFTASELWYIEFGATTGTVNYVTYTAYGYIDRE